MLVYDSLSKVKKCSKRKRRVMRIRPYNSHIDGDSDPSGDEIVLPKPPGDCGHAAILRDAKGCMTTRGKVHRK